MDLFSAKFLVLAVIALLVLGPEKLPGALRTAGRLLSELRRMSAGVQEQSRSVMARAGLEEPIEELRSAARTLRSPILDHVTLPEDDHVIVPEDRAEVSAQSSPRREPAIAGLDQSDPEPAWN